MLTFADVALVWGENLNPNPPAGPPTVSVSAWAAVIGKPWLKWRPGVEPIPPDILTAQVVLVNVFWGDLTTHIAHIRQANPTCIIIACPDPSLDMVLCHPEWMTMWNQMAQADYIGGRTDADCRIYGTLLNKPTLLLPSPIGPTEAFAPYRNEPKGDYILTLDHQYAPKATAQNVAAVAAVQRATGRPVKYVRAEPHTQQYARLAGLNCEFMGSVEFFAFVRLTAQAWACVDMYASHSYGRQGVLSAMVGTPCISSDWCGFAGHPMADPFRPDHVVAEIRILAQSPERYEQVRLSGFATIDKAYSFAASRDRLERVLAQIEKERVKA